MAREMGFDSGGNESECIAALLATGFYDRQHRLGEATATGTLRSKGERCTPQVISKSFGLAVAAIDQRLTIPFQVRPAPLQATNPPVHLGAIAMTMPQNASPDNCL